LSRIKILILQFGISFSFEQGKRTSKEINKYLKQDTCFSRFQKLGGGKDTKKAVQPAD
jgi:hypothetical protein